MAERIEDLLSVRDDEPVEVVTRDRILSDPCAKDELRCLAAMRDALRELPAVNPPERAWQRLDSALASEGKQRTRTWAQVAGFGAVAAVIALVAVNLGRVASDIEPALTRFVPDPPVEDGPVLSVAQDYRELIAESRRLERILMSLPEPHHVMQAGTASTIVGLEDGIAAIDAHLSMGVATGVDGQYRRALWQERVDLMNALVHVRYAQAQRFAF